MAVQGHKANALTGTYYQCSSTAALLPQNQMKLPRCPRESGPEAVQGLAQERPCMQGPGHSARNHYCLREKHTLNLLSVLCRAGKAAMAAPPAPGGGGGRARLPHLSPSTLPPGLPPGPLPGPPMPPGGPPLGPLMSTPTHTGLFSSYVSPHHTRTCMFCQGVNPKKRCGLMCHLQFEA